jgi:hypothetical protein
VLLPHRPAKTRKREVLGNEFDVAEQIARGEYQPRTGANTNKGSCASLI